MARAGEFDDYIRIHRAQYVDNGLQVVIEHVPDEKRIPSKRTDVSDAEKLKGGVIATLTSRFIVRYASNTKNITNIDLIECNDIMHRIIGIKELSERQRLLEITVAVSDSKVAPDESTD